MKRNSFKPGKRGFCVCMVTCLLVASLTWVTQVQGSNIQLSADGTYAPGTASATSQGDAGDDAVRHDTLSTLYSANDNAAAAASASSGND